MDRRLLLVDGSNLLFQMFFGMPSRIVDEQGKAIRGRWGSWAHCGCWNMTGGKWIQGKCSEG